MLSRYKLYFQKGSGSIIDSDAQWGIVCCKVPFKVGGKTKDLPKRNWYDEQGDDAYIPNKLMFEGMDVEFELAYHGTELASNPFDLSLAFTNINNFKKWLTGIDNETSYPNGTGAELKIYSPYSSIGRQGCYLLEISDEDPHVQTLQKNGSLYNENVVTFKVKFRVTDPVTNVQLSSSTSS